IVDASNGTVTLDKELPIRPLPEGEETVVARFAVTRGTVDQCYDRWFELMCVQPRTRDVLTGYTSWYRHYNDIDEAKLASDLRGLRDVFAADQVVSATAQPTLAQDTGIRNVRRLFQIDDGYCKVGDWLTLDKQKFPHGLKPLVKSAHEAGFMAGLWVSPFVCERDSQLFVEHNDWLLRDEGGHAVHAGCHWSGAFALDTRNPEVRTYVLEVLQTITQEWGFDLLKVDFLYAACSLAHDGLNRGQLMADALDLVRTGAGDDCLLLGCGVPLGSAFGKVDFCRIGCDVGLDWDDKPFMRVLHRERVSTKNSLANTYGRAWLDRRAFGNDPDVFFLRKDVKMTEDQKNALLFADATMGSVLLTSDDMSQWDSSAKARFRLALEQLVMPRA
ncbi:MAG: alpha-galactosidase, partial [Eggerthellaceae bacterium]|nr:alpha-galactosidase [Eggerthellaceae bacterium]